MSIKFKDRIMAATSAAIAAYKKGSFNQPIDFTDNSDWSSREARLLRYAVLGQYVNGNPYDKDVAKWARKFKADHGLYEHTRPIANPVYQMAEFYKTYVWGGRLDMEAGNSPDTALPIETEFEHLRPFIAQLWKWSNWRMQRNIVPFYGASLGDVAIKIIDDTDSKKVYLSVVHPAKLDEFEKDPYGNIKAYKISYQRTDDEGTNQVEYTETAERDEGTGVIYSLYKNGKLHAWDGAESGQWSEQYGFVPMVHIQHRETPYGWGEAEIHPRMALVREIDDQRSLLNDQIRKVVNAPWIVSGETADSFTSSQFSQDTNERPQSMREEMVMLFLANADSSMEPMVTNLPINDVRENVKDLTRELESDFPELGLKRIRDMAQASGVAVRRLQQPAANKVQTYRDAYDGALVQAMQMALSIGGHRDIFKGITLDSYASGQLDFSIGKRPVFATDPMDDIEIKKGQSEVLSNMSNVGNLDEAVKYVYGEDSDLVGKLNQVDILEPSRDGSGAAETPETLASEKGLNGAQIKAAVDLLAGVAAGTVAELNAIELLTSLGISNDRAKAMAKAAQGQKVDAGIIKDGDNDQAKTT